jgi:hypothetical protein
MKTASTFAAVVATALALGCTNTIIHEIVPAPDSGTTDDAGDSVDLDATPPDPPDTSPVCVYPAGPYGKTQGSIVSPDWSWQGYVKGSNKVTTLTMADLYDCDGTKGINAILMDEAALWCGPCNQEAMDLPAQMDAAWTKQGVAAVNLVIQDDSPQRKPASTNDALRWRDAYGLGPVANVVADPNWTFSHAGSIGLPTNILIDPRTMKIVSYVEGYGGIDPAVSKLALKNKK